MNEDIFGTEGAIIIPPGSLGQDLTGAALEEQLTDPFYKNLGKKIAKAYANAEKATLVRCRFLIRNINVRKELEQLQSLCKEEFAKEEPDEYELRLRILATTDKWDIPAFTPYALIHMPPIEELDCIQYLDRALRVYTEFYGPSATIPPVYVINHNTQNSIDLRISCYDHPVNELLLLIEHVIKSAVERRKEEEERKDGSKHVWKRRRLDKADFQLSVFDKATEGKTFQEIACELKRPESTIKSAYLIACHRIAGKIIDKKRQAFLFHFDAKNHMRECPTCRSATREREFCYKALAYAGQDYKSLRGSSRSDIIDVTKPRSDDGNRRVRPRGAGPV